MHPKLIINLYKPILPEWFSPEFVLQTDLHATSIIKIAWELKDGKWINIGLNFGDYGIYILGRPKVKFFIIGDLIYLFSNDKSKRFFHSCSMNYKSAQQGDAPESGSNE